MSKPLIEPPPSPYLVSFDGEFAVADAATAPPDDAAHGKDNKKKLKKYVKRLEDLQRVLYADGRYALLLVFQAMDAAGKDGTIRAVLSGVNPAGFHIVSFKAPSTHERQQNFLWRISKELPRRGKIGVFNRSHYEEVLIVRVHPELLSGQLLPEQCMDGALWKHRLESIRDFELHLARNGTQILKFFLNVSRDEQKRRFLARTEDPEKYWKFSHHDIAERKRWDDYMAAYDHALNATSRPWAPWYSIPADDKPFMRVQVARIVARALAALPLSYPEVNPKDRGLMAEAAAELAAEL